MALRTEPVDWGTIEDAIHDWVTGASGIPATRVIWAQQGGNRPDNTWIALNINTVSEVGVDWTEFGNYVWTFANQAVTVVNVGASSLTIPAHPFITGDGPVRLQNAGVVPGGLAVGVNYWVVVLDVNTIRLASSFQNSIFPFDASAPVTIALSSAGTGTNSVIATATTDRVGQGVIAYTRATWLVSMSIQCFASVAEGALDPVSILAKVMLRARTSPTITALDKAGIGINDFTPVKSIGSAVSMTVFEPRAVMDFKFFLAAQVENYGDYIARVKVTNGNNGRVTTLDRPA